MAMNKEVKARWIAALCSGEFKQTKGTMFDPEKNAYCCLGVLAIQLGGRVTLMGLVCPDKKSCFHKFAKFGLGQQLNSVSLKDDQKHLHDLITMNDRGVSFIEIADWIEKNL